MTETMYLTFERDFWRHFLMWLSRLCVFLVAVGEGGRRGRQRESSIAARPQIGTTCSHSVDGQMLTKIAGNDMAEAGVLTGRHNNKRGEPGV